MVNLAFVGAKFMTFVALLEAAIGSQCTSVNFAYDGEKLFELLEKEACASNDLFTAF